MASKAKAKTRAQSAVITMVVDESGSMGHLAQATMAGFNEYVETLKKDLVGAPAYFSAITFDSRGIRKLQVGAPLKDAITLSPENYQPTGGTPLLDAVGKAMLATDEVMAKTKADKAIVVIQTDGEENASVEFTLPVLKMSIETRQGQGWQFVFIGAGINAFNDAVKMGIDTVNTMSYRADAASTRAVFGETARNTNSLRSGLVPTMAYSQMQSELAGECADITRAKMAHGKVKR